MARSKLANPEHGIPLDTAGMPVTANPVEDGVVVINASVPVDHEAHVVYRELSADERRQQQEDIQGGVAFSRASDMLFLRLTRDAMLRATDYLETREGTDPEWFNWRTDLRKLPETTADPANPVWPEPPQVLSQLLPWRENWPEMNWKQYLG